MNEKKMWSKRLNKSSIAKVVKKKSHTEEIVINQMRA